MISFGAGIAERWLAVSVSELEIAVFLVMVKGTTGKLTVGQTVVVASMGKFPPCSEKNYTNQNDQPHQEMNTTNQENEQYVTNLPIQPRKLHAQKPPEAFWKEQACMEHIPRTIPRRIRSVKD